MAAEGAAVCTEGRVPRPFEGVMRIEAGIDGVSLPGFERLVAAMGWNMDVFAVREDEEPNR